MLGGASGGRRRSLLGCASWTVAAGRGNKCRGSSGMGRVVYYTRTSAGPDEFKHDSLSGNGVAW
jgi:hypothetical protein